MFYMLESDFDFFWRIVKSVPVKEQLIVGTKLTLPSTDSYDVSRWLSVKQGLNTIKSWYE